MLLTPKTVSSVLLPVLTNIQTSTLLKAQRRTLSLQTFVLTLTITPFGGKVLTKIFLKTHLTGRATSGMLLNLTKQINPPMRLTPTQDLLLPQRTAPAFPKNLTRVRAFRFPQSSSAAVVLNALRLYINQRIGLTVYS